MLSATMLVITSSSVLDTGHFLIIQLVFLVFSQHWIITSAPPENMRGIRKNKSLNFNPCAMTSAATRCGGRTKSTIRQASKDLPKVYCFTVLSHHLSTLRGHFLPSHHSGSTSARRPVSLPEPPTAPLNQNSPSPPYADFMGHFMSLSWPISCPLLFKSIHYLLG